MKIFYDLLVFCRRFGYKEPEISESNREQKNIKPPGVFVAALSWRFAPLPGNSETVPRPITAYRTEKIMHPPFLFSAKGIC